MLVLALDTSTPTITAGVARLSAAASVEVLAQATVTDPFAHAEQLMPQVRAALDAAGCGLGELTAIAVGLGPGPFTGLRVGVATAQALADGLGLGAYGVPSHDAMAAAAGVPDDLLVVTDARRREVYVSGYRAGRRVAGPLVCAPADIPAAVPTFGPRVAMTGAGVALLDAVRPTTEIGWAVPLTAGLVRTAAPAIRAGADPAPLVPLYLRRPDATEPAARRPVTPAADGGAVNVTVDPLHWWDIPALVDLEQLLFAGDSPWSAEMFWAELAEGHHYVVYRDGAQVVGYAGVAIAGDDAEIRTIGVHPAQQGRGLGRGLLRHLISASGGRRMLLEVRTDNVPAIRLYESEGFTRLGVRRRYYLPSGADAYTMERPA